MTIAGVFADAGADGFLHALALDGDGEVAVSADELVVSASTFKVPVLLELCRMASAGEIALTGRIRVDASRRVRGPTGLSVLLDDADLSIRDLATLMMSVSDNTATDVLMGIVGLERISATLRALGLARTELVGDCAAIVGSVLEDIGASEFGDADPALLAACRANQPERTSRTTPREMTHLLAQIWRDEAGPPDACAEVRRIMSLQVWPHRLRAGFDGEVTTAAKTGTILQWRNEAGVVTYPDGSRYAVAVYTRAHSIEEVQPRVDASIGRAARTAIDSLRGSA